MHITLIVLITGWSHSISDAIIGVFHNSEDQVVMASQNDTGLVDSCGPQAHSVETGIRHPKQLRAAQDAEAQWAGWLEDPTSTSLVER